VDELIDLLGSQEDFESDRRADNVVISIDWAKFRDYRLSIAGFIDDGD